MLTWQKAAAVSSPGIVGLLLGLGWWALDPKGDARQHLIDRGVRLLNDLRP